MTTPIAEDKRNLSAEEREFRTNDLMDHLERMLPHVESDGGPFKPPPAVEGLLLVDEDDWEN